VAVVDPGGRLTAFARTEGAPPLTTGVAQDKARTVVRAGGAPTHLLSEMVKDDMALLLALSESGRLTVLPGGLPVMSEGGLIGAAGVSGGTAQQDREIAEVAVAVVS
jgi:glc operon protein GlcG